jgi:hypothetical protein
MNAFLMESVHHDTIVLSSSWRQSSSTNSSHNSESLSSGSIHESNPLNSSWPPQLLIEQITEHLAHIELGLSEDLNDNADANMSKSRSSLSTISVSALDVSVASVSAISVSAVIPAAVIPAPIISTISVSAASESQSLSSSALVSSGISRSFRVDYEDSQDVLNRCWNTICTCGKSMLLGIKGHCF